MFGKKKRVAPAGPAEGVLQHYDQGQQPNNQPRTYGPVSHQGHELPGHAGYVTYKLRGKNAMTDIRFKYVRPDGKPDRGPGRYAN